MIQQNRSARINRTMTRPTEHDPAEDTVGAEADLGEQTVRDFQRLDTQSADNTTDKRRRGEDIDRCGTPRRNTNVRKAKSFARPEKSNIIGDLRHRKDGKVIGMKDGLRAFMSRSYSTTSSTKKNQSRETTHGLTSEHKKLSIEEEEDFVRSHQENRPLVLMIIGNIAALKVMAFYLITLDTILVCALSVGLTYYWYSNGEENGGWSGGGMDWVILGFAVVTPMSASIAIVFRRREEALLDIARIRSFSYQLYLAHCLWDWETDGGRAGCVTIDWMRHTDSVLGQLIGIGDELSRFLSLPTASRSRHRMTRAGRKEAARTVEVAYRLFDSLYTRRVTKLSIYCERLKAAGLSAGEVSRIRQYERFIGESVEHLRMVKMYRSPQALRSFARIFTVILPPFYAPTYAQIALDLNSLVLGIAFAIITAIGLTALFESIQVLEDPFVAFLTLDGIDVREEFEVLHWQQLVNTRTMLFPDALPFPEQRRAALDSAVTRESLKRPTHRRNISVESAISYGANSAVSYASHEERNSFIGLDIPPDFDAENQALDNIELGMPIASNEPATRNRTSSYAMLTNIVDPPSSATGSISGSERKSRRFLQSTG